MSQPTLRTTVSPFTRRRFLAFTGVAGAAALAAGATQVNWADLVEAAARTPLDPAAGVLVVVTLYGGNDGLNTVVPAADPAYQAAPGRPGVRAGGRARPRGRARAEPRAGRPARPLEPTTSWRSCEGVGYPKPDRSHFRSMGIWQTASPAAASTTGWLGSWLDATTTNPLLAVGLDNTLPPMLAGEKLAAASFPLRGLKLPPGPARPGGCAARPAGRRGRDLAGPSGHLVRRSAGGGPDVRTGAGGPGPR